MSETELKLLSFSGRSKILHMTWIAFFITFVVWFNHAPLMLVIEQALGLTKSEVKTILILNVALTIPARLFTNYVGLLSAGKVELKRDS